jgi:hypothetical protein
MKELHIEEFVLIFRKMHKWNEKTPGKKDGIND